MDNNIPPPPDEASLYGNTAAPTNQPIGSIPPPPPEEQIFQAPQRGAIEQGAIGAAKMLGMNPNKAEMWGDFYDQVSPQLQTPWDKLQQGLRTVAGNTAERMGQGVNIPGLGNVSLPDKVNAGAMLPLAMLPDILSAVAYGPKAVGRAGEIANAGERIGAAEKAAGVITRAPDKLPTAGNAGETLNTLEGQLDASLGNTPKSFADKFALRTHVRDWIQSAAEQWTKDPEAASQTIDKVADANSNAPNEAGGWFPDKATGQQFAQELKNRLTEAFPSGTITDPQTARDAYATANYIRSSPQIVGKSNELNVQSARVGQKAQQLLNQLVPDRAGPAADYRTLKTLQAPLDLIKQAIGLPVEHPGQMVGVAAGLGALKLIKDLLMGNSSNH